MCAVVFIAMLVAMNSCSSDNAEEKETIVNNNPPADGVVTTYTYNTSELETMKLINEYRVSIGLKALQTVNHLSYKSEEHNKYLIANNKGINHDNFDARSKNIMTLLGAQKVGENVAYNYKTPQAVVKGWLESEGHRENIEGDYTHFGLAVTSDAAGNKYYTNIFAKI